jgi:hypothetical protein
MSSCRPVKQEKEMRDDPGLMYVQGPFHLIAREASIFPCLSDNNAAKGTGEKAGTFHRGA